MIIVTRFVLESLRHCPDTVYYVIPVCTLAVVLVVIGETAFRQYNSQ